MSTRRRPANRRQALIGMAGLMAATASAAVPDRQARPLAVPAAQPDAAEPAAPAAVRIGGWLGGRIDANAGQRLLNIELQPLLAGFQRKPGSHPWIGEHIGKWLHAATLAWAYNGDERLRTRMDQVVRDLVAAQEADGYLGTYEPGQRFVLQPGADWDVWSHKYNLIGLLTYHRHTGDAAALQAARRAADLLLATFPARRSILAAGTHMGMAATSVLEPMVLLYRITAETRYLDFARYLVRSWDEPGGPAIVRSLLSGRAVTQVANAKAYEMLSNLVGLVDLARVTGDAQHLQAALLAWQDIVDRRLTITGTTSCWEHFQASDDRRDDLQAHLGETCVTTTWIQFNAALLQLTGQARFADEVERATYNHLCAAQHPQGDDWCYFTPLHGRKRYLSEITCCHSSGPRGLALAPQLAYLRGRVGDADALMVNTFEPSSVTLLLDGQAVTVEQRSDFPQRGGSQLLLRLAQLARFALRVRQPAWAGRLRIEGAKQQDGWLTLPPRRWADGDRIDVHYTLQGRLHEGDHANQGRAALTWGPFVMAHDAALNPGLPPSHRLGFASARVQPASSPGQPLRLTVPMQALPGADGRRAVRATWLPYADAGASGTAVRVWLRGPGRTQRTDAESRLLDGRGQASRGPAAAAASINDDELDPVITTADGTAATQDWFAVTLAQPASARRFVFVPGTATDQGGWFDTRQGPPLMQVQAVADGPWQTLGPLADYPATTDTDAGALANDWDRHGYTLALAEPVRFVAVRVIGRPAGAGDAQRAHASCAELQAFLR